MEQIGINLKHLIGLQFTFQTLPEMHYRIEFPNLSFYERQRQQQQQQ